MTLGAAVAPVDLGALAPGPTCAPSPRAAKALLRDLTDHLDAAAALATGQLQVRSTAEAYPAQRPDDLGTLAEGFRAAALRARADGFPGLRVATEMDELVSLLGSVEEMVRWERMSTGLQREIGVSSVCLYSSDRLTEDQRGSIAGEHAGLAPDDADPALACFAAVDEPWGLRITGEVDISNRDRLHLTVLSRAEVLPRLRLDLSGLTFADVGSLAGLRSVAAGLPGDGWLVLDGASPAVRRTLELCGLGHDRMRLEP